MILHCHENPLWFESDVLAGVSEGFAFQEAPATCNGGIMGTIMVKTRLSNLNFKIFPIVIYNPRTCIHVP